MIASEQFSNIWHQLDPAGFECMYSLEIKVKEYLYPVPASDGVALVKLSILDPIVYHS